MPHDVFVSYSTHDKEVADAVVAGLEGHGVRCWIAPRDMMAGVSWPQAIAQAIEQSKAFVLILSSSSISSVQVMREVEHATSTGISIIPFRTEDVRPGRDLQYYVGSVRWIDALTPPLDKHVERLYLGLQAVLGAKPARPAEGPEPLPEGRVSYPEQEPGLSRRLGDWFKSIMAARRTGPAEATTGQPVAGEEPIPSRTKGYVFISYAEEDADFVERFREVLKAKGYAYWDYAAGQRDYHGALYRELEERIYGAAAFIAIVSDNWRHSDWVASEFTYARDANKPIFVIQAKKMARPFPILLNLQTRIDMSGKGEQGKRTLLDELAKKGL